MGNDGGSIPDRRDLVKSKKKAEQADKNNQTRARWFYCALSKAPLVEPIVSDALGQLYNKDAILEFLLDRGAYGDGEEICGHIKSLKDVKTLKLTPVTSVREGASEEDVPKFQCPLSQKAMTGHVPFVYLVPCGCVMSQAGFRALSTTPPASPSGGPQLDVCPQCATKFDREKDVRQINPPEEESTRLRLALAAAKAQKKSKKRKSEAVSDDPPSKVAKKGTDKESGHLVASRAVQSSLAMEEAKRKASMSDAVKSLYGDPTKKRKETFTTMGTFTRYA
ncbi:unnamed protein product [Peniophora sp. CBMAI 1063]|nr:unnamed protein product [Peniophora sp. CBMAI 1063]